MSIVDTTKRVFRVVSWDGQGRRVSQFFNAYDELHAQMVAVDLVDDSTTIESIIEIDPVTGTRITR